MAPIVGAVAVFIVAALLWYQSQTPEHFTNPPVAGRWFNPAAADAEERVPTDLNRAPIVNPSGHIPQSQQRPQGIPGPQTAPREAIAQRKDMYDLDNKISTWLAAAAQREADHPGSLTPEQSQRRIMLQMRLATVRNQLVNDNITDTYKQVAAEIADLRQANSGWGRLAPSLDALHGFAKELPEDAFLTIDQYRQFRILFDMALNELKGYEQPEPLQRVRLQQLQVFQQELQRAERLSMPPPIRVAAARLFLEQSLRVDQPLPTLFSMEPNPATLPTLVASPRDILGQLRDIKWRLTISYDPAGQELVRTVAALMQRLQADDVNPAEVEAARSTVAELQNRLAPSGVSTNEKTIAAYDPQNLRRRATTLCRQVREAFGPEDASALGCPKAPIDTEAEAESTINIVCDRIRYSVPSVSAQQFNCPPKNV
jgi:hypothetical protein